LIRRPPSKAEFEVVFWGTALQAALPIGLLLWCIWLVA
jgi:hypothetical protein